MASLHRAAILALAACALAVPSNHRGGAHQHLHQRSGYGYSPKAPSGYGTGSMPYAYPTANATETPCTDEITATYSHPAYTFSPSVPAPLPATTSNSPARYSYPPAPLPASLSSTNVPIPYSPASAPSSAPVPEASTQQPPVPYSPQSAPSSASVPETSAQQPAGPPAVASTTGAPAGSPTEECDTEEVTVTDIVKVTVTVTQTEDHAAPSAATSVPASAPDVAASSHNNAAPAQASTYEAPSSAAPAPSAQSSASSSSSSSSPVAVPYPSASLQPTTTAAPASTSAPSSSASATPSSYAPSSGGSGKRGLAYNDASLLSCFTPSSLLSWTYNWGSSAGNIPSGFKFIPMLWGPTADFTGSWFSNAKAAISNGAQYLMTFNEPDMASQSNLTPAVAAAAYLTWTLPFVGQNVKLVAPSVTNGGGDNMGLGWLKQFLDLCVGCQIDAINLHWYDSYQNTAYFKSHIQQAQQMAPGKDIFVSEFGCTDGSDSDIASFLQEVMPWMDAQDSIKGYSYFMVSDGKLVNGNEPSTYGQVFATYTGSN